MKGLFIVSKNRLSIMEIPEPEIGEYEALVEVKACGICNSTDWKIIEGRFKKGKFPILLGHESVGKVVKVGKGVHNYKEEDLVLRSRLYDNHISIKGGSSRFGGFVEKAIVTDVWAEKGVGYNDFPHPQQIVPAYIKPEHASVMITLKENLSSAQSMVMWAKLLGIAPVVVFGRRDRWAERFSELGADIYDIWGEFSSDVQRIISNGGFDRVIEAVGSNDSLSRCLEIVKQDGKVNLYGMPGDDEPYVQGNKSDPRVFRPKIAEAEVHGKLIKYIEQGKVNLSDWVDHILKWNEYQKGFNLIKEKKSNKVVLKIN